MLVEDTMELKGIIKGRCHCGAVEFEVNLKEGIDPRRCDCSMCLKRGAIVSSVPLSLLTITKGEQNLSCYQFNTLTAEHYFCAKCGIYTHHKRRSHPDQCSFNLACLEGVNPLLLKEVPIVDGINHPSDR